jgi:hypothetical protein
MAEALDANRDGVPALIDVEIRRHDSTSISSACTGPGWSTDRTWRSTVSRRPMPRA